MIRCRDLGEDVAVFGEKMIWVKDGWTSCWYEYHVKSVLHHRRDCIAGVIGYYIENSLVTHTYRSKTYRRGGIAASRSS